MQVSSRLKVNLVGEQLGRSIAGGMREAFGTLMVKVQTLSCLSQSAGTPQPVARHRSFCSERRMGDNNDAELPSRLPDLLLSGRNRRQSHPILELFVAIINPAEWLAERQLSELSRHIARLQ